MLPLFEIVNLWVKWKREDLFLALNLPIPNNNNKYHFEILFNYDPLRVAESKLKKLNFTKLAVLIVCIMLCNYLQK